MVYKIRNLIGQNIMDDLHHEYIKQRKMSIKQFFICLVHAIAKIWQLLASQNINKIFLETMLAK
jgi:hypothetical protein